MGLLQDSFQSAAASMDAAVQLASRFACDVTAGNEDQMVNAKSVMGLLLLCGAKGTSLIVEANGDSAEDAVRAIGELIDGRFGEEE